MRVKPASCSDVNLKGFSCLISKRNFSMVACLICWSDTTA